MDKHGHTNGSAEESRKEQELKQETTAVPACYVPVC